MSRYRSQKLPRYFRADAAFANPEVYEFLEAEDYGYAIRLSANDVLQREIEPLLTRPVGRSSNAPVVWYAEFPYQAQSWKCARRCGGQGGVAQGRVVPPRRLHRYQSEPVRQNRWSDSTTSVARPSSGSKKARTPSNGPGCPVTTLPTTKCVCSYLCWRTIWATFCGRPCCPESCGTGR